MSPCDCSGCAAAVQRMQNFKNRNHTEFTKHCFKRCASDTKCRVALLNPTLGGGLMGGVCFLYDRTQVISPSYVPVSFKQCVAQETVKQGATTPGWEKTGVQCFVKGNATTVQLWKSRSTRNRVLHQAVVPVPHPAEATQNDTKKGIIGEHQLCFWSCSAASASHWCFLNPFEPFLQYEFVQDLLARCSIDTSERAVQPRP